MTSTRLVFVYGLALFFSAKLQSLSILRCEANLPAIPEHCPFDQIDFADGVHISRRSGKSARAALKVNGIGNDREQSLREWSACSGRRIKEERVSRFGHPVVLHVEDHRITWTWLGCP